MAAYGNNDLSAYPIHADVHNNQQQQQVSGASSLAANIGAAQNYDTLLRAISQSMQHGNSSVSSAISDLINEKARQPESQAPVNLAQRGSTAFRRSEMVDFEGRVAARNDIVKVNPIYPLGVIRDLSKAIKSGRDLPSTTSSRAYPKPLMPNHTIFKIVDYEIINFSHDKELSTQFILKPVINSDGTTWLQTNKLFVNYLNDDLPWEIKVSMSKMYKNAIMGSSNEAPSDKQVERWNPRGWYLYVNPFENRNEAANGYLGNVALSFSFLSPREDMRQILEKSGVFETFDDLNAEHLRLAMNFVSVESDKFYVNNTNAVSLFNYKQVEKINTSNKYKAARGKRIGNKLLKKPYSKTDKANRNEEKDEIAVERKRKRALRKLIKSKILNENEGVSKDDDLDDDDSNDETNDFLDDDENDDNDSGEIAV